jgi:hypothetical protein
VVIGNITENLISKNDHSRKTYSLPAELPPINPQLPSLVNSLQDQRSVHLEPQNQELTKFLQAVQNAAVQTTTERYSRTKLSRNPYDNTEVRGTRQRLPTKQTVRPFQQLSTRYQETTTATSQSQYAQPVQENTRIPSHSALETDVSKHQPPYSEFDNQFELSQFGILQEGISIPVPQISALSPTNQSQYQQLGITEHETDTNSQKHIHETKENQTKPREGSFRTQNTVYQNSEEVSKKWQSQYLPSAAGVSTKQEASLQYPHLESAIAEEQPQYINHQPNIQTGQTQYPQSGISDETKNTQIREEVSTSWPQNSESHSGATQYTAHNTNPRQTHHSVLESAARPLHLDTPVNDAQIQPHHSHPEESDGVKAQQIQISPEGIINRQQNYPVLVATPENAQRDVLHENIPQRGQQYSKDYPPPQEDILLHPVGVDEQNRPLSRDEISKHRSQYQLLPADVTKKQPLQSFHREQTHSQYQDTEQIVTARPNYTNPHEQIPSHVTQYANSPDTLQPQHPILTSEVLTPSTVATTTPAPPVRTPSRGINRGRYRPSNLSTSTPTSRTRSPYSRGRRPVTRTTSEAPDVQTIAAGQVTPFESSRRPSDRPQAYRSDTQQREKPRLRGRGSSTTTTSPQYNSDFHQENLYDHTPTQNSKTDTVSENFPNAIPQRQQQAPSSQLTLTQFPDDQLGYTQPHSTQPLQGQSGQVLENQFSNSQSTNTRLSSGPISDVQTHYSQIPKAQNFPEQFSNINKYEQQQIPIGQGPHVGNINDEADYFHVPTPQTTHSRNPHDQPVNSLAHSTKLAQNHISGVTRGHSQGHAEQDGNYQLPSGQVTSNRFIGEQSAGNQFSIGQSALFGNQDTYRGQSAAGQQMAVTARTLSDTAAVALQQDGLTLHQLPQFTEYSTQRPHSAITHDKHRNVDASAVYHTTESPATLDGQFRGQGDSYIVTTDRTVQDGTQKPAFVRLRASLRGRHRTVQQQQQQQQHQQQQQPVDKTATTTTASPELQTIAVNRKHTNFINRGSARKTHAPTVTPAPDTTTPINDKVKLTVL